MTLHPEGPPAVSRLDSLHDVRRRGAMSHRSQTRGQPLRSDGLVVPAVHRDGACQAQQPPQGTIRRNLDSMAGGSGVAWPPVASHVLLQGTSQGHVQYLHPSADSQDRPAALPRLPHQGQLQLVAGLIGLLGAVRRSAVEARVDIHSTGQEQATALRQASGPLAWRHQHRLGAGPLQAVGVTAQLPPLAALQALEGL
jgi:hypothetical protein